MLIGNRSLRRSRLVLLAAATVVVVGLVVGLGAFVLSPARAAVGPLPPEALVLPADARFLMGFDVQRLTASPFYERYALQRGMKPQVLVELERRTGLDPARDVDEIVVAGSGFGDALDTLTVAIGRFDRRELARTLQAEGRVRKYDHQGVTVYALRTDGQGTGGIGLAFLGDNALVVGGRERVESAVASRARGEAPLRSNHAIIALAEKVRPGSTLWMVGDETLLSGLPTSMSLPGSAPGATALSLPALRSLTVTGDLDPQISLAVTGEASDDAAAKNLADVVRGLVALATIQAQQKPELQKLTSAVSVATEANRVLITVRLPYELVDALQASARPPAPGPTPPAAPVSE